MNTINNWIFYTVKREYRKRWITAKEGAWGSAREYPHFPKIPNKKDLVFKLLDLAQKSLKQKIIHIKDQDRAINRVAPSGQKTHHKRMIPVYRGYKKTYLKQKESIEEGIKILKEIFKKEWN